MIDLEVTLFLCLLTSERGGRLRTEDASGAAGAVHSLWSRLLCGPLKMHRVPQEPVLYTEYPFCTGKACFLHRMLPKMRRVPQEAFLSTECQFRTVEGGFGTARFRKRIALGCPEQESGWQLPLRGLSTPGRGRGKLPLQRSLAYILVDLIQDTKSRPSRNGSRSILAKK